MDLFEDIYNQTEKAVKKDVKLYEAQEQLKGRIKQKVKIEVIQEWLTLDNIFQYANDEELEAIVHSIHNRILGELIVLGRIPDNIRMTDKELHKIAKGLRKPQ